MQEFNWLMAVAFVAGVGPNAYLAWHLIRIRRQTLAEIDGRIRRLVWGRTSTVFTSGDGEKYTLKVQPLQDHSAVLISCEGHKDLNNRWSMAFHPIDAGMLLETLQRAAPGGAK